MVGRRTVAPSVREGEAGRDEIARQLQRRARIIAVLHIYGAPPTAIFRVALTTLRLAMQYSFAVVLGAMYYVKIVLEYRIINTRILRVSVGELKIIARLQKIKTMRTFTIIITG